MTTKNFLRYLLILLCAALALTMIGRYTDVDLHLADAMFDFSAMAFPWRHSWFATDFMHHYVKVLMFGLGVVPVVILVADRVRGGRLLEARTKSNLYLMIASAVLISVTISILKALSAHHCPWSLARYGGVAPYFRIFDSLPVGASAGHCFPAGHASSGLWLASIAVFWLPKRPKMALLVFMSALVPGVLLGWVQQMRGAHFLTHTLWSAWIAALIILVLSWLFCRSPIKHE